ncbi:hypothetical protein [Nocardia wallacei]|uniref:hypothetical protein n=1 Tax=Nocardia wallacei TaxID=480035 RepID=UPI00245517A5|nr:hypothetical protein [Nocardia wallacei]
MTEERGTEATTAEPPPPPPPPPPLPTLAELLAAMGGDFDPHHPAVTIMRASWLLAQVPTWYRGDSLAIVRTRPDGTVTEIETASTALRALGIDVDLTVGKHLVEVLIAAAGGPDNPNAEQIAGAVERLAGCRAAVAAAPAAGHAHDVLAEHDFTHACQVYDTLRTGHDPADAPDPAPAAADAFGPPQLPATAPPAAGTPPAPSREGQQSARLPIIGGRRCIACGVRTTTAVTLSGRRSWTLAMVCLLGGHATLLASLAGHYLTTRARSRPATGIRCHLCARCAVARLGVAAVDPAGQAPAHVLYQDAQSFAATRTPGTFTPSREVS